MEWTHHTHEVSLSLVTKPFVRCLHIVSTLVMEDDDDDDDKLWRPGGMSSVH